MWWTVYEVFQISFGIFMAGYGLYYLQGNAGLIDWVYCTAITVATVYYQINSKRYDMPHLIHTALTVIWGVRILYLGIRRILEWPEEDSRYVKLRELWGPNFERRFFRFWPLQACCIPILTIHCAVIQSQDELGYFANLGFILTALSIVGEAVADEQMTSFKNADPLGVCKAGFWRYSRHPNYFFEYTFYLSQALITPWALISSSAMLLTLLKVTGIPPSERAGIRKRGDAYRQYQKETSMFIPWWPNEKVA